jgi:hypothetical protein
MPAITIITLIVLFLMLYVILRYRRAAHPVPSRTYAQHHGGSAVDPDPGADPGGDRGSFDPPARPTNIRRRRPISR